MLAARWLSRPGRDLCSDAGDLVSLNSGSGSIAEEPDGNTYVPHIRRVITVESAEPIELDQSESIAGPRYRLFLRER